MVNSSKILTVSYGTFSCTLEGFDNSFDTMKAIAEYFRDLAQDDRYFGAEPPVPDADMLAKIAEREIARRVEARVEEGNLVLRPTQDAETPHGDVAPVAVSGAALAAAGALAATSTPEASDETEAEAAEAVSDLPVADQESAEAEAEVQDEPVAEDVSEQVLADIEEDGEDAISDAETDQEPAALADMGDEDSLNDDSFDEVEDVTPEAAPVQDSVADKLQRIRAVVSAKQNEEPDYIEDEHAMSGPDGDGNPDNDAIDVMETRNLNDADMDAQSNVFSDTIASLMEDQLDEDGADSLFAEADDELEADDAELEEAALAEAEADALRAEIAALQAELAQSKRAVADETPEADDTAEYEDSPLPSDMDTDAAPLRARVLKVKRADFEAALASGDIEDIEDEGDSAEAAAVETDDLPEEDVAEDMDASPVPGAEDSSLSTEDEDALARELAQLQAEIAEDESWDEDPADAAQADDTDPLDAMESGDDADDDIDAAIAADAEKSIRKAVKMTSPARAMLTDNPIGEDDTAVDRLAKQTDDEMDEPEGNRRRSAIAHLRAAVAATKADRILGGGKKKTEDEAEPYREDLATAVRPRRPKPAGTRSERPDTSRPAPLKLVAEQRVDAEEAASAKPVRPRRVLRSADADMAAEVEKMDDGGFADFAESVGANSLPELLEAAASYMSFVEGRDQFSRPQLMTKVQQVEDRESSREERLRSFGQLLRDGKLEKTGGGRFTASDSIGFKPDARAAG